MGELLGAGELCQGAPWKRNFMVVEYVKGGDFQLISAVDFCHGRTVIHCNLIAVNLFAFWVFAVPRHRKEEASSAYSRAAEGSVSEVMGIVIEGGRKGGKGRWGVRE